MHENALKIILQPHEIERNGELQKKSVFDFDNRTEEIPLEEAHQDEEGEFNFEKYGVDDPFFSKLGISFPQNGNNFK